MGRIKTAIFERLEAAKKTEALAKAAMEDARNVYFKKRDVQTRRLYQKALDNLISSQVELAQAMRRACQQRLF